jgi:hypothetical protein
MTSSAPKVDRTLSANLERPRYIAPPVALNPGNGPSPAANVGEGTVTVSSSSSGVMTFCTLGPIPLLSEFAYLYQVR